MYASDLGMDYDMSIIEWNLNHLYNTRKKVSKKYTFRSSLFLFVPLMQAF